MVNPRLDTSANRPSAAAIRYVLFMSCLLRKGRGVVNPCGTPAHRRPSVTGERRPERPRLVGPEPLHVTRGRYTSRGHARWGRGGRPRPASLGVVVCAPRTAGHTRPGFAAEGCNGRPLEWRRRACRPGERVMTGTDCPGRGELARFAVGDLDGADLARVAAHVEHCSACESALGAL